MAGPCICLYFSYLFLFRKVKIKRVVAQLNSNINNLASVQNSKVDKTQLSGNGTMINTICLYKNEGDGKLYLQVNWNNGIAYIQADQTSGL